VSMYEALRHHVEKAQNQEVELTRKIIDYLDENDLLREYGAETLMNALKTAAAIAEMWTGRSSEKTQEAEA